MLATLDHIEHVLTAACTHLVLANQTLLLVPSPEKMKKKAHVCEVSCVKQDNLAALLVLVAQGNPYVHGLERDLSSFNTAT